MVNFRYKLKLNFSEPVTDQSFLLRCLPMDTTRQRVRQVNVQISPKCEFMTDTDGLGNGLLYGVIREPHDSFELEVSGDVETGLDIYEEKSPDGDVASLVYTVPSPYTQAGDYLKKLHREYVKSEPVDPYDTILFYGNRVQEIMTYTPGATTVETTAEEAAVLGKGVCQDYAHVMIALLRMSGIPARYAIGIMKGEGESHAWVEACCNGYWYGIDPTNNALVNENYVLFARGRDYGDCMISRGVFNNPRAVQTMQVQTDCTNQ